MNNTMKEVLAMLKVSREENAVFCTSNIEEYKACEELIAKGWAIEMSKDDLGVGSSNRVFMLTQKGAQETAVMYMN